MTETFEAIYKDKELLSLLLKLKINNEGNLTQIDESDNEISDTNPIEIPNEVLQSNIGYEKIDISTTGFTIDNDHGMSSNKSKILSILKRSNNLKFLSVNDLFNEEKIDKSVTLNKFLEQRKNNNINIEGILFSERYD